MGPIMKITDDMLTEWFAVHPSLLDDRAVFSARQVRTIVREAVAARRTTPDRECEWKCDDVDNGIWESACGESWSFIDGGPVENRMLFCHRCGGKLKTAPTSDKGGA
ncbi:hypothetical protein HOT12_gp32 [Burkholderia phage vB_BmuP_KL4]|uniref:Uncharacterized protein n=1 Tax=Burkholderia phage vB_BmuP_KL4 TaxID=2115967 RepID=A0A2S1GN90_9CAUD|nr:hypothetical protein HOT12_gp32 [Burkholderia phage vB_BmuP_KL4]AWD90823.1 hypothetical protein [Burkholderia phage vB_BmuP_KL4]